MLEALARAVLDAAEGLAGPLRLLPVDGLTTARRTRSASASTMHSIDEAPARH